MRCTAELTSRRRLTRAVGVVAGVVIGLSVTACGGDSPQPTTMDTPTARSTPTKSATPTPTPTPTPSETAAKPGEVRQSATTLDPRTEAEATSFVRRFIAASDRATNTGDFTNVKSMVTDQCVACRESISYYTNLYRSGGKVKGGELRSPKFHATGVPGGSVLVRVETTVAAYTVVQPGGKGKDHPAERATYTYSVKKDSAGRWHVTSRGYS